MIVKYKINHELYDKIQSYYIIRSDCWVIYYGVVNYGPVNPPKVELKGKPIIKYKGVIEEKQEDHIVAMII